MRLVLLATVLAALTWIQARADGVRVALVIGVSAYEHVPRLPNTTNDARAVAQALQKLHFDVDLVLDPDRAALEGAVRRLGQRARGADAALLFYAGHAAQLGDHNWLVPTNSDPHSERDMPFEALDLDLVRAQTDGAAHVTLLFLDSCRDNPFKLLLTGDTRSIARGGLAQTPSAVGTLVVYATAPGSVASDGNGPHSPFTTALLAHIGEAGVDVRQLLAEVRKDVREATSGQQVPWENSALEGNFYFNPAPVATTTGTATATATATGTAMGTATTGPGSSPAGTPARSGSEIEALFWQSIRSSHNAEDFKAYLARYPAGVFAPLAKNRLAEFAALTTPGAAGRGDTGPAPPDGTIPGTLPGTLPGTTSPRPSPPPAGGAAGAQALEIALNARLGFIEPARRNQLIKAYIETLEPHKAFLIIPARHGIWRTGRWPSAADAETGGAERCQLHYGMPCKLLAIDETFKPDERTEVHDMPRTHYDGVFDPKQLPGVIASVRDRADVRGYVAAAGAKASAVDTLGHLAIVTGAANDVAAQTQALASCVAERRSHEDTVCYLYAIGNAVVLPQRLTAPKH